MVDFAKRLKTPRLDLNPSSADRWTTCTASPHFILQNADKLPPGDTVFSQEGTTAHEVASALLQNRKPRAKDPYHCPTPIDAEMNWNGWNYMEYVEGLRDAGENRKFLVEQKMPLWYMEGRHAIVDTAVLNTDHFHVIDYKYGAGVAVSPVRSLQGTIYTKSIANFYGFTFANDFPVTIHIHQPRDRTAGDNPAKIWETTWGEVSELADNIADIARKIQRPDFRQELVFAPSEKACKFCPVNKPGPDGFLICSVRQQELLKDLPLAVIDDSPRPVGRNLSENQLAAIVKHGDAIKKWIDDAKEFALSHMKAGGKIPGFKLVTSRGGHRFWTDPKKAGEYLGKDTMLRRNEIFTEKLIGPAAVEKLLGKGKFPTRVFNLIAKPPGQPVIAEEGDDRESALVNGASEFVDLDAGKSNLDQF